MVGFLVAGHIFFTILIFNYETPPRPYIFSYESKSVSNTLEPQGYHP